MSALGVRGALPGRARRRLGWLSGPLRLLLLAALVTVPGQTEEARTGELDLDLIDRELDRLRRQEHSLRRVLEEDKSELEQLRARIVVRGRAYYRLSRSIKGENLFEHAVRLERLRQALLRDMRQVDHLATKQRQAGRGIAMLERKKAPLEVEVAAAGRARDALLSQSERERAFQLAFSASRGPSDHTAVYSAGASLDMEVAAQGFGAMRGRLPFPVPGRAEVQAVRRDYADGPGLVMRSRVGAPARSVFSGRVAFSDEYPNYGRTVIIDHGDGYFTVTAGLSSLDVKVGEEIPAGSRLGMTSTVGAQGELYFEVRQHAETLPPGQWFGI